MTKTRTHMNALGRQVERADPLGVPLHDPGRQNAALAYDLGNAIDRVLSSGRYILGEEVSAFEAEFAAYCGAMHCVSVGNGSDALELALRAAGCGRDSDVITVANAGMYASGAIVAVGARPVFADVDDLTMTMSPASLARCVTDATNAVVVTHLYGRMADIEGLSAVVTPLGIPLIEDCAQAHGAERGGRRAGTFGIAGCFSFYPTKNLGAVGDGGAVITQSRAIADRVRALRQYGWRSRYVAEHPHGRNSRLDELQAAILRVKLRQVDAGNMRRRAIMHRYRDHAAGSIAFPPVSGIDDAAHLCVVRTRQRERLRAHLQADGIATAVHYPIPDHRQPALRHALQDRISLPLTERIVEEILTIPCFPEMTETEIERVSASLARFGADARA